MAKRALCVGINRFKRYPQFTLQGCVNDARDMAALCRDVFGFKASEVTTLLDAQATKARILAKLQRMVADARAGKVTSIVFTWSSHGTQIKDASGDEPDGMDEAFVPYDVAEKNGDWDPDHIISDDELHDLFVQLPAAVRLEVWLDTCHSGSGLRGAEFSLHAPRPRYVSPPSARGAVPQPVVSGFTLARAADAIGEHQILWTGCRSNQTSADAYFDGRYNGAFTYFYVQALKATNNTLPRKAVVDRVRAALKGKFSQVPQLETNAARRDSVVLL